MGLAVTIDGVEFYYSNDYSVSEDATAINPADMGGGVGSITLNVSELVNSRRIKGKAIHLSDSTQGSTQGVVGSATGSGDDITLDIDTRLYLLTNKRIAAPYNGTLLGALTYYFSLVGITSGFVVDASIQTKPVTVPGWDGVVWDVVKSLAAVYQFEIAVVSDNVIVRPIRQFTANNDNELSLQWSTDDNNRAQEVEVLYYQNKYSASSIIYPLGSDFVNARVDTVDASATIIVEHTLTVSDGETGLGVSIASLVQPIPIASTSIDYNGPSSYTVIDKDGKVVDPLLWEDGGGSVTVAIGEDTRSIIVTITGMRDTKRAPYSIAVPAVEMQDSLSSLCIWGAGVFFDKQSITIPTGNTDLNTATIVGATVDNMFINTLADATRAGAWSVAAFVDGGASIDVSAMSINRTGKAEDFNYPTVLDFNTATTGLVGTFNTAWSGKTIHDFNLYQKALVAGQFDNQGFGNIAGARVYNEEAWYRIRTATINDDGVSYTADLDTTVGDFNTIWAATPTTVGAFNALMAGATVSDHAAYPLRKGL